MIANCPSCGTHYKHQASRMRVRARCGRCDTALDLTRFRTYRIVSAAAPSNDDARTAATHLPIGLDHPALATSIAHNVVRSAPQQKPQLAPPPAPAPGLWDDQDPLPAIPEMDQRGAFESAVPTDPPGDMLESAAGMQAEASGAAQENSLRSGRGNGSFTTFLLWLATGALAGTGASWTAGGTTEAGIAAGALVGAVAGWGWLRWTSPK